MFTPSGTVMHQSSAGKVPLWRCFCFERKFQAPRRIDTIVFWKWFTASTRLPRTDDALPVHVASGCVHANKFATVPSYNTIYGMDISHTDIFERLPFAVTFSFSQMRMRDIYIQHGESSFDRHRQCPCCQYAGCTFAQDLWNPVVATGVC